MDYIVNAAPMSYNRGIHDVSGRQQVIPPEDLPTHLAKFYTYTRKGKPGITYLVSGPARDSIFGSESFDELGKYCNHATMFSNGVARFSSQMQERILPDDAPPPASIRLSIDLLSTKVTQYERNSDGTFRLDNAGAKIPSGAPIDGYMAKWVVEPIGISAGGEAGPGEFQFGLGQTMDGDQTDGATSTVSTRYPIGDFLVSSEGEWGNDQGLRFWAPTVNSSPALDPRLIEDQKVYPFLMAVVSRADSISTPKVQATLSGGQSVPFVLKPRTIDRNTGAKRYLGDVFVEQYNDTTSIGVPPVYGSFDQIHLYEGNIAEVVGLIYAAESAVVTNHTDFDGSADEEFRVNLLGATTSQGVPYYSYQIVTGVANSVRLSSTSNLMAAGGGDGTMSNELFAKAVAEKLNAYADINSPVQESAINVESIFYDSGFPIDTKKAFASVISTRKDLFSTVSVYDVDGGVLSDDDERSLATVLLTRFQLYPESTYYATPATRAMIVGGSARPLNSNYTGRLPCSYEIALKSARAMGAGNGQWTKDQMFDSAPGSVMEFMTDVSLPFRPASARFKDWDANLVYPQPYNRQRFFFAALQTINPDDTSVLNNYFTAMACVQLTKIGEAVHKEFSGSIGLTEDQLAERVDASIAAKVKDVFAGRFTITPKTVTTADDSLRGFSWTTTITIYANVSKTVQTLIIEAQRLDSLADAQAA